MTQKQKELLLKDICSRLPYNVKVKIPSMESPLTVLSINTNGVTWVKRDTGYPFEIDWENCKPYLFSPENMTEEAIREFNATEEWIDTANGYSESVMTYDSFDCLNKHYIDYRGLIPMGLAIDATGKNIY